VSIALNCRVQHVHRNPGGDFSGASQPHKHVQFIPVEETELGPPIERLARSINLESPGP
jgi:ATP adenylyltransferase/5',5'''-P-1,P-4-tetraphosphate phosphorylase II